MINILDFIFLNLAFITAFTGILINNYEKYVPAFIKKGFSYGSFAYQGTDANFLKVFEISKSYYRHYYVFSSFLSTVSLCYMILVYFFGFSVNSYISTLLVQLLLQENETKVSAVAALIAMSLLMLQSFRRLYETYHLQVFAKSSKMNLSHYLVGIIHYFGCSIAIIGQAPLFSGDQNNYEFLWVDTKTLIVSIPCIIIFMCCWYEQYKTNVIFANLRKDKKTGSVVSEEHRVPRGRLFDHISSPHRLCEVIIYTVLLVLVPTKTFLCIYQWVLANQIQTALQAHEWYKKTFKDYPTNRRVLIPQLF